MHYFYTTTFRSPTRRSFFKVVQSETIADYGGRRYIRHSVNHPGGSAVVPIVDDHVLLIKQYRPAIQRVLLEIPAGRPKPHETPHDTASRELHEEAGLIARTLIPLAVIYNSPCFSNVRTHMFLATEVYVPTVPAIIEQCELPVTVHRIRIDQIARMLACGDISDAKTIVGIQLALQYLKQAEPGVNGG
jgi:ADP-ribose pyrophosphatase